MDAMQHDSTLEGTPSRDSSESILTSSLQTQHGIYDNTLSQSTANFMENTLGRT